MKNKIYLLLFIYILIAVFTIIFFDGTGDAGDSVYHYLFAQYAPVHPELFFHHWAKPLYVLVMSPFAQFGFVGVKIFNAFISLITIFITYKIAEALNIKNALMSAIIMVVTPLYYVLTFSGLTEPLFAFVVALGIYLCMKEKYLQACVIASFLPFVRSEGIIIIGVFVFYFFLKKQWKYVPFLLTGSLLYSIAGYFVHHDFLWVFTQIPYATLNSVYGSGKLFHFVEQLLYVVGIPIYFLFCVGLLSIIYHTIKGKRVLEEQVLIVLGFVSFFVAHSLFWYLGIFNSMGLKRVLIGMMPTIAIIALRGFNFLTEELLQEKRIPKFIVQGVLVAYLLMFPFTSNPAAVNWKRDMSLNKDQQTAIACADFISKIKMDNSRFIYAHPYLGEVLNIDCFDKTKKLDLQYGTLQELKQGDIIIWENWFGLVESTITKEELDNNKDLTLLQTFTANDNGREIIYAIYRKESAEP